MKVWAFTLIHLAAEIWWFISELACFKSLNSLWRKWTRKAGLLKRWAATVELYREHNRLCPSYWEGERFWMGSVEFKRLTALFLSHACRCLLQCLTYMCATVCHCAGSVSLFSSPLRLSFINPPRPQRSVFSRVSLAFSLSTDQWRMNSCRFAWNSLWTSCIRQQILNPIQLFSALHDPFLAERMSACSLRPLTYCTPETVFW